jgi:radical SAM superfamily enzyme YgiQ (UPF0313 family)
MKNENIVLISLYDPQSFAIRILHAVLAARGFKVYSIAFKDQNKDDSMDYPDPKEISILIDKIKGLNPVFVGISLRSTLFRLAVHLTEKIKAATGTFVVWGGIHPTVKPVECVNHADAVCVGEGEEAIVELAHALLKGKDIYNISNIWIKKDKQIIRNDLKPLIQDLDNLPFPVIWDENKFFIHNNSLLPMRFDYDVNYYTITSRGCIYNCTYCCNNSLKKIFKGKGKYLRRRSPENVIEELIQVKCKNTRLEAISFGDDIFTYDLKWLEKFCIEYKEKINLPFFCFFHPKNVEEKALSMLKFAGVEVMMGGIQSGSENFRKKILSRNEKNSDIIKTGKLIKKYEIGVSYNIIKNNPMESDIDKYQTLKLLTELPKPYEMLTFDLTNFPETQLTQLLLSTGHISEDQVEDKYQKSYKQWSLSLNFEEDNPDLFWENLFFLANKRYIPKKLLLLMGRWSWLKSHPRSLTRIVRYTALFLKTGSRSELLLEISNRRINLNPEYQKIALFLKKMMLPWNFLKYMITGNLKAALNVVNETNIKNMESSIDFNIQDGVGLIGEGWFEIEKQSRWFRRFRWVSNQFSANLVVNNQHRCLVIEGYTFVDHFKNGTITTRLNINNRFLGEHTLTKTGKFKITFELPSDIPEGHVYIKGKNSASFIPDHVNGSGDMRELSLIIYSLNLSK